MRGYNAEQKRKLPPPQAGKTQVLKSIWLLLEREQKGWLCSQTQAPSVGRQASGNPSLTEEQTYDRPVWKSVLFSSLEAHVSKWALIFQATRHSLWYWLKNTELIQNG